MTWDMLRPVFLRLPKNGYGDNDLVDAITDWVDSKLMATLDKLGNFYKELDPTIARAESLDYLAATVGLNGRYWDVLWSDQVKRDMISSVAFLWRNRGTDRCIRRVLDLHGLTYDIWTDGSLKIPFTIPGTLGAALLRYYVRVPLTYHRFGLEYREAERTLRNYAPALIKARVVYRTFAVGISKVGDPLFS